MNVSIIIGVVALLVILTIIGVLSRFRKCKSDEILVIYGKTNGNKSSKCIQGGAAFVMPIIQGYSYMSLKPMQFECNLTKALSAQNIRVDVPTTVTVAIGTEPELMQAAAERLLGLNHASIEDLVKDIVYGQMRTIIADMTIEQLNADRDAFLDRANGSVTTELFKLGLKLINLNITDIRDEAGYIVQLGKKAQATAINEAEIEIAKAQNKGETQVAIEVKNKDINVAAANRDKDVEVARAESTRDSQVADARRERDINVASHKAEAQIGTIEAEKKVVISQAELEIEQAQAKSRALSADEKAQADIEKNKEIARKEAEIARAQRVEAALKAEKIVPAEIAKKQKLIDAEAYQLSIEKSAEADANKQRILAEGNASSVALEGEGKAKAITAEGLAQAEVIRQQGLAKAEAEKASLLAQADGFAEMVKAAETNPQVAIQFKMVQEGTYENIAKEQVAAFKSMNFGNVQIMDTTNGGGLTNVMQSLISQVSPMLNVMKTMDIPGISNKLNSADEFIKLDK